jgi:hypothetical protein
VQVAKMVVSDRANICSDCVELAVSAIGECTAKQLSAVLVHDRAVDPHGHLHHESFETQPVARFRSGLFRSARTAWTRRGNQTARGRATPAPTG